MASETSPAFSFYVRDWLADAKVRAMTNDARGVYIDLLAYCWVEGALPVDAAQLARIARLTPSEFRRIWPQLVPCFVKSDRGWIQKRLERERSKQREHRAKQSENGAKGAEARWRRHDSANGEPMADGMAKNGFSSSSSSSLKDLEQRADARDPDPPNQAVLNRLAYEVPSDLVDEADRADELKNLSVRYGLAYDGASCGAALDASGRRRR